MEQEQQYPLNRGELTEIDLRYLAKALGFQAKVFLNADGVKTAVGSPRVGGGATAGNGGVSEEHFICLLDSGVFNRRLHKTFNTRDADYNVKLTKGALTLLVRKMCSYQEIRQVGGAGETGRGRGGRWAGQGRQVGWTVLVVGDYLRQLILSKNSALHCMSSRGSTSAQDTIYCCYFGLPR